MKMTSEAIPAVASAPVSIQRQYALYHSVVFLPENCLVGSAMPASTAGRVSSANGAGVTAAPLSSAVRFHVLS